MRFIVFKDDPGEMIMKLYLLFIVMDLLTLLAYPIVFVHSTLSRYSKRGIAAAELLAPRPVLPVV